MSTRQSAIRDDDERSDAHARDAKREVGVIATGIVRTFDCWVIFVDEVALDELDCETGLSHATSTDNNKLVFPEEL